jgi:hypothetical protein
MNVIVFALRGCPVGWLGAYGNEWVATPNLDRLAAESVVFDRHISDCATSDAANQAWLRNGLPTGAKSILVRANRPESDSPASFYAGWSEVFDARPRDDDASPLDELLRQLPKILDGIEAGSSCVLWIDIDRLLPPWEVPQEVFEAYIADEDEELEAIEPLADPEEGPFDKTDLAAWEWLHCSFAAVVTAFDAELGSAFDLLRERGWDTNAKWIVTSDFGLPLGEHSRVGAAGSDLHEELVHVPLIVRWPGAAEAGRRIDTFTGPADVGDIIRGSAPMAQPAREFAITACAGSATIRTEEWVLLVPADAERKPMLFVKPDDRWEVHDVASLHEDVVQELLTKLQSGGAK